jgi:ATP-binding cassette subfamily F protein uup
VERRILKLTEQEEQLHAQMAADASDYTRLADLQGQLEAVATEKDRLEEEWLAAAELVD